MPISQPLQQRIGLFGGTFDPIHFGHLRPAVELAEKYKLDHLRMLPNHRPAHRDEPSATTAQRIQMLNLATDAIPQLIVDTREANRDKASYTFDTLTEFRKEYPEASLIFFMGQDAFSGFDSWHRWEDILGLANLVVIDRPDAILSTWAIDLMASRAAAIAASSEKNVGNSVINASAGAIERCSVTQLAISATDIRHRIASGKSIEFLVPENVNRYIVQQDLYRRTST